MTRADRHNNPTAFTTDMARQAGLVEGSDYSIGDSFTAGPYTLYTALILKGALDITIQVINKLGFSTAHGEARWTYIDLPSWIWSSFTVEQKIDVIGRMYRHEGGTEMIGLFPGFNKQ